MYKPRNDEGGVEKGMAYAWSRTRMGRWTVAQSPILGTTIRVSLLKRKGYISMIIITQDSKLRFDEPSYTRPVRTVV